MSKNNTPDNQDDFDLGDDNFDAFEDNKGSFAQIIKENTWAKIGLVAVGVAVVFGAMLYFNGDSTPVAPSVVPTGSDVRTAPGTQEATPAYVEAVQEQNQARVEQAVRNKESALPTPIETPRGALNVPPPEENKEDPLQRWRRLQEERLQRELQRSSQITPAPVVNPTEEAAARSEAVRKAAEVMSKQMDVILQSRTPTPVKTITVTQPEWLEQIQQAKEAEAQKQEDAAKAAEADAQKPGKVLIPAGEIVYAQTLTEANTDSPGPVLAQIAVGPLRGSRLLGSFETQDETLTLTFHTLVVDGVSYSINAIALDPDTTLPALATDVDHRYLQRVALPMAASFVEGLAQAVSESGRTTVTIQGETVAEQQKTANKDQKVASGVEEAGSKAADILDDMADDTKTLIVVAKDTAFGLLFLESVRDTNEITGLEKDKEATTAPPTTQQGITINLPNPIAQ